MRKKIPPNLSLTEHALAVAHRKDYRRDFLKTKNEMKSVLKELVPSLWKWYFEGPGMPGIYCDYDRTRSDARSPFADFDEILNKFLDRWAIAFPIVPHGARCYCNVETAWGPVLIVDRILARFLEGFWPGIDKNILAPKIADDGKTLTKDEVLAFYKKPGNGTDNIFLNSVSVRQKVWEIANFWSHYLGDQNLGSLPHRVFVADQWARTVSKIAPKPGPGRKRNTDRELTTEEKEQAVEQIHAFYRAANGQEAEAIEKNEGIVPRFCLDHLTAALGPPRPLTFSIPVVVEGKVVASIPVQFSPKDAPGKNRDALVEAAQMLQQIGFDAAFVKSFEKKAWRAELEAFRDGHHPRSREGVREFWAELWSDIALFLYRRGSPVSNLIVAHIALSLWERHGFPRPMTSRNKRGNTKTPTIGGLRNKFDRFATEYVPDAEHLLRIVEEEKARHAEEQTAGTVKIKKPHR